MMKLLVLPAHLPDTSIKVMLFILFFLQTAKVQEDQRKIYQKDVQNMMILILSSIVKVALINLSIFIIVGALSLRNNQRIVSVSFLMKICGIKG